MKRVIVLTYLLSIYSCTSSIPTDTKITVNNMTTEQKEITKPKENKVISSSGNLIIALPLDNSDKSKFDIPEIKIITGENKNNSLNITEKPNFNVSKPVEIGKRNAYISLFFKDEFKIRLQGLDSISLKSLTNKDTNKLNDLLVKYNTKKLEPNENIYLKSEEELEKEEKASEKFYGVDYPNKASIYSLYVENTDVKSFIDELRKNEYVLSANENTG